MSIDARHARTNCAAASTRHEMQSTRNLSTILAPDRNSFNLLRIVAALCVIISHSFMIPVGAAGVEPLAAWTPFTLGQHAVNLFFVISGLTLSASLERNPDLVHYAWARFLRIIPPLFAFGVLFTFVAGPLLTSSHLREYFSDAHTWFYPASVLVQFSRAHAPSGIFDHVPLAGDVNNPLWTLKYELIAYVVLAILFSFSFLRRTSSLLIALAAAFALLVAAPLFVDRMHFGSSVYQLGRYEFCFLLGVVAFHFRERISLSARPVIVTFAIVVACHDTVFEPAAYIVLTAHLVIIAGARQYGWLSAISRKSDLSYGTYIYGWPAQQSLVTLIPGIGTYALLALSLAIVPLFAIASWHLIEKPVLALKSMHPRMLNWRLNPASISTAE
jgi:peptidoglycan/LPS O-acetylase OafA/YrhL